MSVFRRSGGYFDVAVIEKKIAELERQLNQEGIWQDQEYANKLNNELITLRKETADYHELAEKITESLEIIELLKLESDDEIKEHIALSLQAITSDLEALELKTLLDGEYDQANCYLEIHPGAGGTEACDWANMLLRMYTMYFDKHDMKYTIIDKLLGEEAGIKSVLIHVVHPYAYGYLKGEIGVHRLVRISPFDANARRHTSFAAVNVIPEFSEVKDIVIRDEDLRVDVYRSSGNGGQGVNTTDSAVRITHIPTGIVVTCQNERSQIKNKEIALNVLKSKLYQRELNERNRQISNLKGSAAIDFGSQIRNYVLEPYSLVKDLRTNYETNAPDKVLDGDLDGFIEAYLRKKN